MGKTSLKVIPQLFYESSSLGLLYIPGKRMAELNLVPNKQIVYFFTLKLWSLNYLPNTVKTVIWG